MNAKRWFLIRIDRRKFHGETVLDVFDERPAFRIWFLNKWANITGREFLYVADRRTERRKAPHSYRR